MWMKHPDLPDTPPAEVAESAFTAVWRHKGWIATDPPTDPPPPDAIPVQVQPGEAVVTAEAWPTQGASQDKE